MYVELHASSAFSFLRASSPPEDLVERAAELGYPALALLDRDGVPGAPRFFKAAKAAGIRPLVGAELTLLGGGAPPVLVESRTGYQNLCQLVTRMKAGVAKGEGRLDLDALTAEDVAGLVALPGLETLGRTPDTDRLAAIRRIRSAQRCARGAATPPPRAGGGEPRSLRSNGFARYPFLRRARPSPP